MTISFTGTRHGMSKLQYAAVVKLLGELKQSMVVHGDCIGADTDFHNICIKIRGSYTNPGPPLIKIRPSNAKTRANNEGYDLIMPSRDPLDRDRDIVNDCEKLIACPLRSEEELRSGTWATVRYARIQKKIIYIINPDGSLR